MRKINFSRYICPALYKKVKELSEKTGIPEIKLINYLIYKSLINYLSEEEMENLEKCFSR